MKRNAVWIVERKEKGVWKPQTMWAFYARSGARFVCGKVSCGNAPGRVRKYVAEGEDSPETVVSADVESTIKR